MIPVVMPQPGETITEAVLVRWHRKPGELVEAGTRLFEIETEKAAIDIDAVSTGLLADLLVAAGQSVAVGAPLATIYLVRPRRRAESPPSARLSPAVRRLLQAHSLSEAQIVGTGPEGRITKQDVLATAGRAHATSGEHS